MEMFRAEVYQEPPEGKEWRMCFVTHAQYGQELQALMDQGLSQLEAFLIAPPGPGSLRMMLVDKGGNETEL